MLCREIERETLFNSFFILLNTIYPKYQQTGFVYKFRSPQICRARRDTAVTGCDGVCGEKEVDGIVKVTVPLGPTTVSRIRRRIRIVVGP